VAIESWRVARGLGEAVAHYAGPIAGRPRPRFRTGLLCYEFSARAHGPGL